MVEAARIVPPDHLGEPTPANPDPFFIAVVDKMLGLLPVEPSSDPTIITGVAASAVSNESGALVIPFLLPGEYKVTAEQAGFKSYLRSGLELRVNDALDLPIRMGTAVWLAMQARVKGAQAQMQRDRHALRAGPGSASVRSRGSSRTGVQARRI